MSVYLSNFLMFYLLVGVDHGRIPRMKGGDELATPAVTCPLMC